MANFSSVTESAANTAVTLTITMPSKKNRIVLRDLVISTRGADLATDVEVDVKNNGTEVWSMNLRAGQLFGAHIPFPKNGPIVCKEGDMTITAGAGGASVLVKIAATYEIF